MNTRHFQESELACKCCGKTKQNSELMVLLELVRVKFGKPVTVTSGYRCETHNKVVGGAVNSQHPKGTAADIVVSGVDTRDVYEFVNDTFPNQYGLGFYPNFTHVDVRPKMARW